MRIKMNTFADLFREDCSRNAAHGTGETKHTALGFQALVL